jgi:radical SAM protein with 4Fe4S-binding SPASM domain
MLCRAPWRSVVVLWDGRVVPCCHDANGETVLGDLKESSLAEIWAGVPAAALRARLRDGNIRPEEPCSSCAHRPDRYERSSLLDDVPVRPLHW